MPLQFNNNNNLDKQQASIDFENELLLWIIQLKLGLKNNSVTKY